MSTDHKAIVEKMFSAFAAQNLEDAVSTVSEDTLWIHHGTQKLPSMRFVGAKGVRQFFEINFNTMHMKHFEVKQILQSGNQVIAFGDEAFTMAGREDILAQKWVQIYTVDNGLITRMEEFATSADEKNYLVID